MGSLFELLFDSATPQICFLVGIKCFSFLVDNDPTGLNSDERLVASVALSDGWHAVIPDGLQCDMRILSHRLSHRTGVLWCISV